MDSRPVVTTNYNMRRARNGFTLVEVLVTTVIVAIAVVGVMGAISSTTAVQASAKDALFLQSLANEKLNDLRILQDPSTAGSTGDFSDRGYPDIIWTADVVPSNTANLDQVTITVTKGKESQVITTLMYVLPAAGTTAGTGTSVTTP
jgi:type II secretion system protein I